MLLFSSFKVKNNLVKDMSALIHFISTMCSLYASIFIRFFSLNFHPSLFLRDFSFYRDEQSETTKKKFALSIFFNPITTSHHLIESDELTKQD
jgi:hemolysin-activating ACP:hemolysin acyltransferase